MRGFGVAGGVDSEVAFGPAVPGLAPGAFISAEGTVPDSRHPREMVVGGDDPAAILQGHRGDPDVVGGDRGALPPQFGDQRRIFGRPWCLWIPFFIAGS